MALETFELDEDGRVGIAELRTTVEDGEELLKLRCQTWVRPAHWASPACSSRTGRSWTGQSRSGARSGEATAPEVPGPVHRPRAGEPISPATAGQAGAAVPGSLRGSAMPVKRGNQSSLG